MQDKSYIFFWRQNERYGCFSNWYETPFIIDGVSYRWTEQFMMAEKARLFNDDEADQKIMKAGSPNECKKLGRTVKNFDPVLWDEKKFGIVCQGNLAKFQQNPELLAKLMETKDSILVEASPYDKIWGIGLTAKKAKEINPEDWPGENLLGKALMKVREELR